MSLANRKYKIEYQPDEWRNTGFGGAPDEGQPSLKRENVDTTAEEPRSLANSSFDKYSQPDEDRSFRSRQPAASPADGLNEIEGTPAEPVSAPSMPIPARRPYRDLNNLSKKARRDFELLHKDRWLVRNGHLVTYVSLYIFSLIVLFRPYEILPGLTFMAYSAFYTGVVTLIIFFPSQLAVEGNLTILSTEVKALLAMTAIAFVLIPISVDPATAWEAFNDSFVKAVAIFIVLVNVVRTRKRLMQMMWLSFGIGVYLSACAVKFFIEGKFSVEAYRVAVTNIKGIFGNPNEMALHFVMMTPITLCLALAEKSRVWKAIYFTVTALFIAANMVTYSRGGFLGLIAVGVVLVWKLGRKAKFQTMAVAGLVTLVSIVAAPGNYGLRMISIFVPSLDPVGSSDARRELLERSIMVSLRKPWGIGIGNFPIVATQNHQTHNAFTQVSSELGVAGFIAYMIFMIAPYRRLRAIERTQFDANDLNWFYYLSIGLQASIIGYWVGSFFASVAYNWFIYYLLAYAVAFRRIYALQHDQVADEQPSSAPIAEPFTA